MDPILSPAALADPIARLAAVGAAIAILTEVFKQYIPEERVSPPVIAGLIAALFTVAWEIGLPVQPTIHDTLAVLLLWVGLFQSSIAIYHAAKLSQGRRAIPRHRRVAAPAGANDPPPSWLPADPSAPVPMPAYPPGPPRPDPNSDPNVAVRV
jgi:hypothetical protein